MSRLGTWALLVTVTVSILGARTATAVGFQPVSPDELKMTSEPQAPGAPAIILYRQVDRDDDKHIPHEDDYFRIKILTEEGRKYADVEVPFFKATQNVINVHARTIRPDGSIANFDGKVYEKYLVKGKIEGQEIKYLAKTFTLPDVGVGSIVEYYYTIDFGEYMIFDSNWTLSNELFTKKARFTLKPFQNDSANQFALRWSWNTLPAGSIAPALGPDHIVRMESSNIAAFQTEDYMPPATELMAHVNFIYEEGFNPKDQASYWKEFGKKRNGQLESFVGKRKEMEQALTQIVSPGDSPDVKLRKIYDRVQQLRNTSYEVEKTEQEQKRAKEKPVEKENVADVWKQGYGNGSQLTRLFLGLVRAAGFEAHECWVSERSRYFFTPVTMEGAKLNSNVIDVKVNGRDTYFDPGAAFTPFGLLPWTETGVQGLRLDRDGGAWIQTTIPASSDSQIERAGQLKLSDTGDLEGKLTVTFTGLEAASTRVKERNADEVARKKFLEDLVASQIPVGIEIELTNKPDWTSSETPIVAEFNLKIPGWASSAGRRAVIPATVFTAAEKGMFEHVNRVHPIYFQFPHQKTDDLTVELPPGWQVSSLPPAQNQDAKAALYSLKVDQSAGKLRLTRNLRFDLLLLDSNYYGALRNFFQVVRNGDGEQIVLQPGEIHASN